MSGNNGSMPTAVEFIRGETVESIHGGVAVVVDHTGRIIAQFGDADFVTFSRSSLKPLQALAAVERGVIEHWGLHERHLAIMCGSHSGEEIHVTTAREILDRIGCTDADYQCGVHVPTYFRLTNGNNPIPARGDFTQLHNNCSGKHAGMLAFSRFLNADIGHYLELDHPVQVAIRESIAQYSGVDGAGMPVGIDGCSAPNYALPIRALALAFARMGQACATGSDAAAARVMNAMRAEPKLISGSGRFDLALAEATRGRLISKVGAEAIEAIAIPERGWGMVAKILDGQTRALGPFVVSLLAQLGILDDAERAQLMPFSSPQLRNHRDILTGSVRTVARLSMN